MTDKYPSLKLEALTDPNRSITYGVVKPGPKVEGEDAVKFIRGGDIANGSILLEQLRTISPEVSTQYSRTLLRGGELLVSLVGNPGQVAIVPEDLKNANIARQVGLVAVSTKKVNPTYLKYYLLSRQGQASLKASSLGSVQQVINLKDLKEIEIPIPPKDKQKAIAHILGTLDDKIELNRRTNETLEAMAQDLFKSWFVDFDPVIDNALEAGNPIPEDLASRAETRRQVLGGGRADRETAKHFPDAFQPTDELGWIPQGWTPKLISEVIKRMPTGKKFAQKTASTTGAVPILDQGRSGIIGFHNEAPGVRATPSNPIVVFANHTCLMRLVMHDFSAIQNVLPFRSPDLNTTWLYFATERKQKFVEYKGHWPDLIIQPLAIPSTKLADVFERIAAPITRKIYANTQQIETLGKLRDSLFPKLISGDLTLATSVEFEAL